MVAARVMVSALINRQVQNRGSNTVGTNVRSVDEKHMKTGKLTGQRVCESSLKEAIN